jgi:hypothetical protein
MRELGVVGKTAGKTRQSGEMLHDDQLPSTFSKGCMAVLWSPSTSAFGARAASTPPAL